MTAQYTPDQLRAQVAQVRALAHAPDLADFSLASGVMCGMMNSAANQLEILQARYLRVTAQIALTESAYNASLAAQTAILDKYEAVKKENDFLRAVVGNSDKACVYCGLGAENQGQCVSGFPGCARGDDQSLCRNFGDAAALHDLQKEFDAYRKAHP